MLSVMFSIPKSVCCDVLSLWLDEKNLLILDSAVCNKKDREVLLDLFTRKGFIPSDFTSIEANLHWVTRRRICLSSLHLNQVNVENLRAEQMNLTELTKLKIRRVILNSDVIQSVHELVQLATKLRVVIFCDLSILVDEFILNLSPEILGQIKVLVLDNCEGKFNPTALNYLATKCSDLRTLKLISNGIVKEHHVIDFLNANACTNLTSIKVDFQNEINQTGDFLAALAKNCPAIRGIECAFSGHVNAKSIGKVINNCKLLTEFSCKSKVTGFWLLFTSKIVDFKPTFKILDFSCKPFPIFKPEYFEQIVSDVQNLDYIKINRTFLLTPQAIHSIAYNNPHIFELSLVNCRSFTEQHANQFFSTCTQIDTIELVETEAHIDSKDTIWRVFKNDNRHPHIGSLFASVLFVPLPVVAAVTNTQADEQPSPLSQITTVNDENMIYVTPSKRKEAKNDNKHITILRDITNITSNINNMSLEHNPIKSNNNKNNKNNIKNIDNNKMHKMIQHHRVQTRSNKQQLDVIATQAKQSKQPKDRRTVVDLSGYESEEIV